MELEEKDPSPEDIKWIFSAEVLEHLTPSRKKGISHEMERRYRREGARFISNTSNTLKLRRDTLATGTVFFHRFYMVQNFADFDKYVVAAACVLLAGKVEETPKKCKDIVRVAKRFLSAEQSKSFGEKPLEELISFERVLLQTIRFDLQVDHPYGYLLKFAKHMKGEKQTIEKVLQMAWTFINDSLCTTLCLQWEPPVVAVALLYLAGKLSKFDLQSAFQAKSRSWWRQFVLTVDAHDLESICHQVLDVYSEEEKEQEAKKAKTVIQGDPVPPQDNASSPPPPPPPTNHTHHKQHITPLKGPSSGPSTSTASNSGSYMTGTSCATGIVHGAGMVLPPGQNNMMLPAPPPPHSMLHPTPSGSSVNSSPMTNNHYHSSLLGQPPQPFMPHGMNYTQSPSQIQLSAGGPVGMGSQLNPVLISPV
uniref:Cyclin-like domain-containing protein n=1 Tax=Amphimedon queenslandica TaxID=400682 RepID=A0A1X7VAT7_AMPQE